MVANVDNDNGSSLTFSAVFTRKRHHCIRAFSTCTHGFLKGVRQPSISGVANLDPIVSVRRGAAGGGPESAIKAAARICSFFHLLCTETKRTCSCLDNRGVIGCARRRALRLVLGRCGKGGACLLTPLIHGHGKRCGRLFRRVQGGNCLGIQMSNRVGRVFRNVGLSQCGVRDVRIIVSGLIISRSSRHHLGRDLHVTVGRNSKLMLILSTRAGRIHRFDHQLVSPIANLSCDRPTPRGFSFGSPRNTYPGYGKLKRIGLLSVGGVIPSTSLDVCDNNVITLKGCGGSLVF